MQTLTTQPFGANHKEKRVKSYDAAKVILNQREDYFKQEREYPTVMFLNSEYYNALDRGLCLIDRGRLYGMTVLIDDNLGEKEVVMK